MRRFDMYKSIDLFAGIGGIRIGFDRAFGRDIKTVFVSEWDQPAQQTYRANFSDDFEIAGDITKIHEDDIPEFDICLAGFPCQAFSTAGKHGGFEDDFHGRCRGTLFLDVVRICDKHKPKVIFCENVKGLIIHDKGRTFKVIREAFEQIGYTVFYKILNSKDFGVPQNRERIYLVCFRNDIAPQTFNFPKGNGMKVCIKDIMDEAPVSPQYYLSEVYVDTLKKHRARHEAAGHGFGYEIRDINGIAGTIVCGGMGRERNLIIDDRPHSMIPVTHIKGDINKENIRKMTPREWARLQGFPDSYKLVLSDTHLYKQFGNSVTINVVEAIAREIRNVLIESEKKAVKLMEGDKIVIEGSKNKGDWAEFYALIYLLAKRRINSADENLNSIPGYYFPIVKISRDEKHIGSGITNHMDYVISQNNNVDTIEIYMDSTYVKSITSQECQDEAELLLPDIINGQGRQFDILHAERFLNSMYLDRLAAPSSDIADIKMTVHDTNTARDQDMGFSIKSYLGGAPTLLNASTATNFIYEVTGLTDAQMDTINAIDSSKKINDRIAQIIAFGGEFHYEKTANETFSTNLMMIDSMMETIIAEMLLYHYRTGISNCIDILNHIEATNSLGYPREGLYIYKFKKFLCAKALGMDPSKEWGGMEEANGGYIAVKSNGEVLAYFLYDRIRFEQYLLDNTKFERASTSKHDFAYLYKENNRMYMKFNLDIRFKDNH